MVIVEGRAQTVKDGKALKESGPGAVIGEMALLTSRPRAATVTLLTDARLLAIGRREFQALMDEMPSVRAQVMECLAFRLLDSEQSSTH